MMLCGKQGLYLQLPSSRAHMEAGRLKSSFSVEVGVEGRDANMV